MLRHLLSNENRFWSAVIHLVVICWWGILVMMTYGSAMLGHWPGIVIFGLLSAFVGFRQLDRLWVLHRKAAVLTPEVEMQLDALRNFARITQDSDYLDKIATDATTATSIDVPQLVPDEPEQEPALR